MTSFKTVLIGCLFLTGCGQAQHPPLSPEEFAVRKREEADRDKKKAHEAISERNPLNAAVFATSAHAVAPSKELKTLLYKAWMMALELDHIEALRYFLYLDQRYGLKTFDIVISEQQKRLIIECAARNAQKKTWQYDMFYEQVDLLNLAKDTQGLSRMLAEEEKTSPNSFTVQRIREALERSKN